MDKETILAKSRNEHVDEGELHLLSESKKLAFKVCAMLSAFFMIFSLFFIKDTYTIHIIMSIFWGTYSTHYLYKYKFDQNRTNCIALIAAIFASVGFGILAILEVLRG